MRRRAALLASVLLASCGASSSAPDPVLVDIHDIGELRARFDADADAVRIVLLMSPT